MLKTVILLLLIFLVDPVHAAEPDMDVPQIQQAQDLIKSGKPGEAYALLQPLELDLAGNVRYDYLLGISALNSGNASQAVFALERVQASDPEYGEAGLWLAISYFSSGDMERAKRGFASVVSASPNPASVASAKKYLRAIDQIENSIISKERNAVAAGVLGKLEFGLGYDNNISNISSTNPSTTQLANTLSIPSSHLGGMESILNYGMELRSHMTGDYVFVSVDEGFRKYPGHGVMNSKTAILKAGVNLTNESGRVSRMELSRREFRQEGHAEGITDIDNDYNIGGLSGNTRFKLSEHDYLGVLAQYNQLHFMKLSLEDTHQIMLGTNFMHVFQTSGRPVFYLGYTNVDDTAVQSKLSYNPTYNDGLTDASRISRNYFLYLQYSMDTDLDIFSADYFNYRRDKSAYARDAVIAYGEDKTRYLSIGLDWRPWMNWTVIAEVANTNNDSNIAAYSYKKTESRVILRREFSSL